MEEVGRRGWPTAACLEAARKRPERAEDKEGADGAV